jgi:phenylpyruvate tautomerase PptA (4-oxalocrotonate tautomerase family)
MGRPRQAASKEDLASRVRTSLASVPGRPDEWVVMVVYGDGELELGRWSIKRHR